MITRVTEVGSIPALEHDEAMRLAGVEYDRLLAVVDDLREDDWSRPTECPGWDVNDMLGHVLGMLELQSDGEERMRQIKTAAGIAAQTGGLRLDALTALQVREHASLAPRQLTAALHTAVPRALAARKAFTAEQRAATYVSELPGEGPRSVDTSRRHLPGDREGDGVDRRSRWAHRCGCGRGLGPAARKAVHTRAHRTCGRLLLLRSRRRRT